MWFRKLVGICMIIAFVGMNLIIIIGLLSPPKKKPAPLIAQQATVTSLPTVTLSAEPGSVSVGSPSALKWATTDATTCTASGGWSGQKTPFGAESTGRLSNVGNVAFTLTCSNASGEAKATATVSVGGATPPKGSTSTSKSSASSSSPSGASYCSGRLPCYGPKEVASHSGSGNCWGWNGDRVINISGFDAAFHQIKSGIGSIEVSGVCGKDLGPSLSGAVSADGQTRNHNSATKINADKNEIPYFVGYFDASKP